MSVQSRVIVQPYARGPKGGLKPDTAIPVRDAAAGLARAERMMADGRFLGVDVVQVEADEEAGDYSEPVYLARLGQVPEPAN